MKKLLAIIVTVLCMAMLFTGCAGAAKNAQPNNAARNETEAADKQLIFVNPKSIGYHDTSEDVIWSEVSGGVVEVIK